MRWLTRGALIKKGNNETVGREPVEARILRLEVGFNEGARYRLHALGIGDELLDNRVKDPKSCYGY